MYWIWSITGHSGQNVKHFCGPWKVLVVWGQRTTVKIEACLVWVWGYNQGSSLNLIIMTFNSKYFAYNKKMCVGDFLIPLSSSLVGKKVWNQCILEIHMHMYTKSVSVFHFHFLFLNPFQASKICGIRYKRTMWKLLRVSTKCFLLFVN